MYVTILSSGYSAGWGMLKLILITILVLVLAFYATRMIAKYQNNTLYAKSNIRFIESCRVDGNKMIAIAKIGEKYFALGIGKQEINVIGELREEDLNLSNLQGLKETEPSDAPKMKFKDVLANMKGNTKDDNEK